MNPSIFKVSRNLTFASVAVALLAVSAHAKSPKKEEDQYRKGNSTTEIVITVNDDNTATITSGKEISHVVIWYCNPLTAVKYEEEDLQAYLLDSSGKSASFSGSMMSVMAKSGTSEKVVFLSCTEDEITEDEFTEDEFDE